MSLIDYLNNNYEHKLSLARNFKQAQIFAEEASCYSMNRPNFGLSIPPLLSGENQIRGAFNEIMKLDGLFLFCINDIDFSAALNGFISYREAEGNFQITEWELFLILQNEDYFQNTIFHNRKSIFKFEKDTNSLIWQM